MYEQILMGCNDVKCYQDRMGGIKVLKYELDGSELVD